jgi:hypothetical protein
MSTINVVIVADNTHTATVTNIHICLHTFSVKTPMGVFTSKRNLSARYVNYLLEKSPDPVSFSIIPLCSGWDKQWRALVLAFT